MSDIKNIKNDYLAKLNNNLSLEEINQIKTELFGKNGLVSTQFKNIGSIPEVDRKKFASDLNQIKDELQNLITSKINEIESKFQVVHESPQIIIIKNGIVVTQVSHGEINNLELNRLVMWWKNSFHLLIMEAIFLI